jgi:molybdopterin-guanine dinucleotide biosynthesis protein A
LIAAPIVLAGGKSTRFGRDKISQLVAGEPLIQRVINRLASFGDEIIMVLAPGIFVAPFPSQVKIRKVYDIYPGRGSLGGVYTGLVSSTLPLNIVVACDMPFLNVNLLQYMIDISQGYDLVIPRLNNNVEPLHAVYSKNCIKVIERLWEAGKTKVLDIQYSVKTRYVEEQEIDKFDPKRLSFINVNTQEDLKRAIALSEELEVVQS